MPQVRGGGFLEGQFLKTLGSRDALLSKTPETQPFTSSLTDGSVDLAVFGVRNVFTNEAIDASNFQFKKSFETLYSTFQQYQDPDLALQALGGSYDQTVRTTRESEFRFLGIDTGSTKDFRDVNRKVVINPDERLYSRLLSYEHDTRSAFLNSYFTWS